MNNPVILQIKQNKTTLLLILVGVLVTVLVMKGCQKTPVNADLIRSEERTKYLEKDRLKDSVIWAKKEVFYDSLLAASDKRLEEIENRKQPLIYAINKVPSIVDNFDKEQLRRASAAYYEKYK